MQSIGCANEAQSEHLVVTVGQEMAGCYVPEVAEGYILAFLIFVSCTVVLALSQCGDIHKCFLYGQTGGIAKMGDDLAVRILC